MFCGLLRAFVKHQWAKKEGEGCGRETDEG